MSPPRKSSKRLEAGKVPDLNSLQLMKEGLKHAESLEFEDALTSFESSTGSDPSNPEAWFYQGSSLYNLGRYEEAISCYDNALEFAPGHSKILYNKGAALERLGLPDEAVVCYQKALETDPTCAEALYNLGVAQEHLGRHEDAAASYQRFVDLDPPQFAAEVTSARMFISSVGKQICEECGFENPLGQTYCGGCGRDL